MDDMLATLRSQLLELKLKYLAAQLDDFMLTASCSDKPYAELLHDFLDVEIRERRAASMDKRLRMANLPTFDTPLDLEYFDFAKRTGVSKRQIIELTSHFRWIDKAYNTCFLEGPAWVKPSFPAILLTKRLNQVTPRSLSLCMI